MKTKLSIFCLPALMLLFFTSCKALQLFNANKQHKDKAPPCVLGTCWGNGTDKCGCQRKTCQCKNPLSI